MNRRPEKPDQPDVEAAGDGLDQRVQPSLARIAALTLTRAVCGSAATTCFYVSLQLLSLKDSVTLFYTSPVIAALLDWLVLGRSPGFGGATATCLVLLGATCVTQPPFIFKHLPFAPSTAGAPAPAGAALALALPYTAAALPAPDVFFSNFSLAGPVQATLLHLADGPSAASDAPAPAPPPSLNTIGIAFALSAAVFNAIGFMAVGLLKGQQPPLVLTWWHNLVIGTLTAVPLAFSVPFPAVAPSSGAWLLVSGIAALQLVAQFMMNRGFQLESAGRGAAINVLQVLFSFILDVAILHNRPSLLSVLGSALVAAGVLFMALRGPAGRANSTSSSACGSSSNAKGAQGSGVCASEVPPPAADVGAADERPHRAGSNVVAVLAAAAVAAVGVVPASPASPRRLWSHEPLVQPLLHGLQEEDEEEGEGGAGEGSQQQPRPT
ncbi:hypothetical protein HXX76_010222 [Chlamydomonas incerta]|uniref:EamA domain-containing protein n=1 Tax=Chlamydomonas incerta TaxID=51695 RepID=A0A835VY31_CHLIN|nr:hypothetical protein HXX76_010222 [Chlamydomonas incerta]|eukprot:KAG2430123.1 hypothetical protein HXX76_010222 [Chlamydomonas incerta]